MSDLFSFIEGKRSETLSSALLCWLLRECPRLREGFMQLVCERLGLPLSDISTSRLRLEARLADDEAERWGYIDVLLETDRLLLGIENKLGAVFGFEQVQKYQNGLVAQAGARSAGIVLLVPKARYKEATGEADCSTQANPQIPVCVVTWKEVQDLARDVIAGGRAEVRVHAVLAQFCDFIELNTVFLADFTNWQESLEKPIGSDNWYHETALMAIRALFAREGLEPGNISTNRVRKPDWQPGQKGYYYYGFYIWKHLTGGDDSVWAWCGFLDESELIDVDGTRLCLVFGRESAKYGHRLGPPWREARFNTSNGRYWGQYGHERPV